MNREYLNEDDIKKELLAMLCEVDSFLCKNGLRYTIYGGTLLGAIRHNGFIPWDDDIDLGMLRRDYDKLIRLLCTGEPMPNSLESIGIELENGDWPFIKIINKNIRVAESGFDGEEYLWIDIFPIDNTPKHFRGVYLFFLYNILRKAFFCKRAEKYGFQKNRSHSIKTIFGRLFRFAVSLVPERTVYNYYINYCKKYTDNFSGVYSENVWGSFQFPNEIFDDLVDYQFEQITVKGIKEYDEYLRILYGDYMKLPPENQRKSHNILAWRVEINEKDSDS